MKKLSACKWKAFYIEEVAEIDSGRDIYDQERVDGTTPYVTATATNNGVGYFVGNTNHSLEEGCISVNRNGSVGYAFYHPYKALFGNDTRKLRLFNKSKYVALFIVRAILAQKDKYEYGYKLGTGRLKRQKIMLPMTPSRNPDYAFMDQYMRAQERKLLLQYKSRIDNLLKVDVLTGGYKLQDRRWGDFSVTKIFRIESGKRLESNRMKLGCRPFIGAADSRNGVTNFVSNVNESLDKNVLGVNYNGNGMVISFHHPYECIFSDDVKRFHLKDAADDKYVHLFLKEMLLCQKKKFCYGYKFNASRMARQKIMLPVRRDGKPDYEFMRDYMKQCERRRLIAYRDRIEELLSA